MTLDQTDRRLLAALQENAHLTAEVLGQVLNLSASQAGRRRQRLEQAGLIRGYGARLDPEALGLKVQAFVQVQMGTQDPDAARALSATLQARSEVVSIWTMTGEADFLLRVWCPDLPALNHLIHEVILPMKAVNRVQSQIVLDQMKADAPLPV